MTLLFLLFWASTTHLETNAWGFLTWVWHPQKKYRLIVQSEETLRRRPASFEMKLHAHQGSFGIGGDGVKVPGSKRDRDERETNKVVT
mmetsp:Transcript_46109/g.93059  ORF Transcript_46109/g.93059 Transcript_46109/m.93059 type:complete len:88 (+) Transcript_46109:621-884(+)